MLGLILRASSEAMAMRPSAPYRPLIALHRGVAPARRAPPSRGLSHRHPALPAARPIATSAIRRVDEVAVSPEVFDPLHCPLDAEEVLKDPLMAAGYLYFDSVFPIKLGFWDLRSWVASAEKSILLERIHKSIPPADEIGHGFVLLGVEPRMKDGGAFVSFAYKKHLTEERDVALLDIERKLKTKLKPSYDPSTLILFNRPSVHVVRGKPWREDMNRWPAPCIKIQLVGGDVSEQRIWEILRVYGRISTIQKSANEAKVQFSRMRAATSARNCAHGMKLPEGATLVINYERKLRARVAWEWFSNHPRIVFPLVLTLLGTITYAVFDPIRAWFVERKLEATFDLHNYKLYTWLREKTGQLLGETKEAKEDDIWFERHQAAKNIAGLLKETPSTFITIAGPRGSGKGELIKRALEGDVLHLDIDCEVIAKAGKSDSALVTALASETGYWPVFSWLNSLNNLIDLAAVGLIGSKAGFAAPIDAQLRQVLSVVSAALVSANTKEQKKAKKKAKKAGKAVHEQTDRSTKSGSAVSGSPANEKTPLIGSTVNSEEAGVTQPSSQDMLSEDGSKAASISAGFTDSIGQGVTKLKGVILGDGKKEAAQAAADKAEQESAQRSTDELDMEKGLASATTSNEGGRRIPVVVIKGFHHKGVKNPVLWQTLAEWAAELVSNGVAHVVFVSDNPVAMSKELTKALPNRPFEGALLADADHVRARKIVSSKVLEMIRISVGNDHSGEEVGAAPAIEEEMRAKKVEMGIDDNAEGGLAKEPAAWVDKLGGRLTDLETLIQKVGLGQSVKSAVEDVISRTVIELRKNAFGDDAEDAKSLSWSRGQAWTIVSQLASKGELSYYGLLHDSFKGDENALKAMEQAEIISVRHVEGRPSMIRAGRPVFLEAMRRLIADPAFADTQRYLSNAGAIATHEITVREVERELKELAEVYSVRSSDVGRVRAIYLLEKMQEAQQKIETLDKANAALKKKLVDLKER